MTNIVRKRGVWGALLYYLHSGRALRLALDLAIALGLFGLVVALATEAYWAVSVFVLGLVLAELAGLRVFGRT